MLTARTDDKMEETGGSKTNIWNEIKKKVEYIVSEFSHSFIV